MLGNILGKIITGSYKWYYNRETKKHQKKKLTEVEKKKVEFYENMQQLYGFVTWLNTKGFVNRHARKTFWRNVVDGQSVLEDIMTDLINKYAPKKKKDKEVSKFDVNSEGEL